MFATRVGCWFHSVSSRRTYESSSLSRILSVQTPVLLRAVILSMTSTQKRVKPLAEGWIITFPCNVKTHTVSS